VTDFVDILTGKQIEVNEFTTGLSNYLAPDVIRKVSDFDVPEEIVAILGGFLSDLHIAYYPVADGRASELNLLKKESNTGYARAALLNQAESKRKSSRIRKFAEHHDMYMDEPTADTLGVEWSFFELAGDALSNSVYMQNRFERYVSETNVQAGFDGHLYIVKEFADASGAEYKTIQLKIEQTALKRGLALEILPDAIVRHGVTDNLTHAQWLSTSLRNEYPSTGSRVCDEAIPFTVEELVSRFRAITVRPAFKDADEYCENTSDVNFVDDGANVVLSGTL
jgi:hypothetical protein